MGRSHDRVGFEQCLRSHDREFRSVVYSVIGSGQDLDEVLQNAYEKAYRNLDRFEGRSSLATWLHSICYREAVDHIRRDRAAPGTVDIETIGNVETDRSPVVSALIKLELSHAFGMLTPRERVVLMLTAGYGYSFDEVSCITGLPRGTAASTASRARSKLRSHRWT